MTKEKAIEILKANYPDKCYELLREAVDTAIKSLENEPVNLEELSQALTDEVIAAHERIGYDRGLRDGYAEAIEAGPLVRCKDCKHWAMHSWCSRLAPFDKVYMGADDYCSKGKRKDEV